MRVLMQGNVSGLQVLKFGKWVAVEPIPIAFVLLRGLDVVPDRSGLSVSDSSRNGVPSTTHY
jgi:hypothetical protein